jgi:hypothetical protein
MDGDTKTIMSFKGAGRKQIVHGNDDDDDDDYDDDDTIIVEKTYIYKCICTSVAFR